MKLRRFLRPETIRLELETRPLPDDGSLDELEPDDPRNLRRIREGVFREFTELFDSTGEIANANRLRRELLEREGKAPSALGGGLAVPHARTLQARSFVMAFGRSREGLPFAAPDEEPVHLFFAMAAPPYEDSTYLKVYKALAKGLLEPETLARLLEAEEPSEVLFLLKSLEG